MELADVPYRPGAPLRICTAADDVEAEAREAAAAVATLRRVLAREAREAEAMAAAVMGGQWLRPVQPVRVEPMMAPTNSPRRSPHL